MGDTPIQDPDAASADLDRYRVLVVEDDRSQAMFAQAILRGAGMEVEVVDLPNQMMTTLEAFAPDLVLMDLHMPGISGTSLTAQIRDHAQFRYTPVVFLTGDQDPDSELDALEHGGDDYIVKPVRPKHLVVAVQTRIRRARAISSSLHAATETTRHPVTGLHTRAALMKILLESAKAGARGGAFLIEMGNAAALHDRYGYAEFEELINAAGRRLNELTREEAAARLSDNAFLVVGGNRDDGGLEAYARHLRDGIEYTDFQVAGETLRLRCTIGYTSFEHGFQDAGDVLAAAEDATREAHGTSIGIARYSPPDRIASHAILDELQEALAEGKESLYLAFQPVVAVAGGEEARYQVLLRLQGGDGGVRKAAEFLGIAQDAGLVPQIDRWVMAHSLALLAKRQQAERPVHLLVSQTARTLGQDDYAPWLEGLLAETGVAGPNLIIDLRLEDALVHGVLLRELCSRMVPSGVQFCLSQYRHSLEAEKVMEGLALGYLRLSADFAQQAQVPELHDEMRVAIDHAHRHGLKVIAQGVEDPQAAASLWVAGIDYIQGNLVHRPERALDFDFKSAIL